MKLKTTLMFIFTLCAFSPDAKAESASDIIGYLAGKASSFTSASKIKSSLCKKASFFGLKYSLRSADGIACKDKHIGAIALKICKGYEDFDDSHCAKNAEKNFPNGVDAAALISVVKDDAKTAGKIACIAATFIPEVGAVINIACEGLQSATD